MDKNVTTKIPVIILGAGNWMVSYDRIGPRVIELLAGVVEGDVELRELGTTGLDLLDHVDGQELLVVIDAAHFGGKPGEIRVTNLGADLAMDGHVSVHQINPVEAFALCVRLFPEKTPLRSLLVAVETNGLGAEGEECACLDVVGIVRHEIRAWRQRFMRTNVDTMTVSG